MIVFVVPDDEQLGFLKNDVRKYLAWKQVSNDADTLNLDTNQRKEAANGLKVSDDTVRFKVNETYCWLLAPYSREGTSEQDFRKGKTADVGKKNQCGQG